MPGIYQQSVDQIVEECREVAGLGIPAVILFGLPEQKDELGSEAADAHGAVQRSIEAIRKAKLESARDHRCLPVRIHQPRALRRDRKDGEVLNDPTSSLLADAALSHARAGADIVAPSDMMDGRVAAIRQRSSTKIDFEDVAILSYAAKYCSGFYGPFREAAQSAPQFGDRRSYQMDPANAREALREVALDLEEGADMIMVKPALPYLDIIQRVRERFDVPVAAYNVSGEYSMVKAAARNGWIDEKRVVLEIITGIQRAGAEIILTYHAKDVARWLKNC